MDRFLFGVALLLGAISVLWMGTVFVGTNALALTVIVVIGCVYGTGVVELAKFRQATSTLSIALSETENAVSAFDNWLEKLDPSIRNPVRMRIEGDRTGLPAPVMTPYLVGLLVMLGLLGTFIGMVDILSGAVSALEGTTELQAIREGLAEPMRGLGLAFGTSVAGVSASAMLGLMSTLSRRERILETRRLDASIQKTFQAFSLGHRQRETLHALQVQTQGLPQVVMKLDSLANSLSGLSGALVDHQERFHASIKETYCSLTTSLERSLEKHLKENVRQVGAAVQPVVQGALSGLGQEAQEVHQQLSQSALKIMQAVSHRMDNRIEDVSALVKSGIEAHRQLNSEVCDHLKVSSHAFTEQCQNVVQNMDESFKENSLTWLSHQQRTDKERLDLWAASFAKIQESTVQHLSGTAATFIGELKTVADGQQESIEALKMEFSSISTSLVARWQKIYEETQSRQKDVVDSLTQVIDQMASGLQATEQKFQKGIERLMNSSDGLIQSRMEREKEWLEASGVRFQNLTATLKQELGSLRNEEASRGQAAVERLSGLESVFASHLKAFGQSLETPLSQLFQSAAETQGLLGETIHQIRQEEVDRIDRDNRLLEEQRRILEGMETLFASLSETTVEQGESMNQLVETSRQNLERAGQQFVEQVDAKGDHLSRVADAFAGSAVEMATLGDAFGSAVDLFSQSNGIFFENLSKIETALDQVAERSDTQLAYYVAQAREIIDRCMLSQKEMFSEMSRLRPASDFDLEAG